MRSERRERNCQAITCGEELSPGQLADGQTEHAGCAEEVRRFLRVEQRPLLASWTWELATAMTGQRALVVKPYPHVHGIRHPGWLKFDGQPGPVSRRHCAACGVTTVPAEDEISVDASGPVRTGIGGHPCRPAGRGNDTSVPWACPDCGARWHAVASQPTATNPVVTITWERVTGPA